MEVVGIRGFDVMDPRKKVLCMADGAGQNAVKTQMPGRIVRILVGVGDVVEEGDPLIVVEAMKMEEFELKGIFGWNRLEDLCGRGAWSRRAQP